MTPFDNELYARAVSILTRDNDARSVSDAIHDYQAAHDFAGGHMQYFRNAPSLKAGGREGAVARLIEVGILTGHRNVMLGGFDITLDADMRNDPLEMDAIVEHNRRAAAQVINQYETAHPATKETAK